MTTDARHSEHDERPDDDCPLCRASFDAAHSESRVAYRAERELRQALALARADLDMGLDVDEQELMAAIQRRFKR